MIECTLAFGVVHGLDTELSNMPLLYTNGDIFMIVALALDEGIVASRVLEGSFTHDTFIEYLRDDVLCFEIFILYQELILF